MKAAKDAYVQVTALSSEAVMVTILVSGDKVTKALRKDRLSQAVAKVEKNSAQLGVKIRPLMHPAILAAVQKYLLQS